MAVSWIILNLSFMVILYVNVTMRDAWIIWLFSNKGTKYFVNANTFLEIDKCVLTYLFFNVYWFLRKLNRALHSLDNTQNPDVFAYLLVNYAKSLMALFTSLSGKCASALRQKSSAAHRRVGVFQLIYWL